MSLQNSKLQGLILGGKTSCGKGSYYSVPTFAFWTQLSPSDSLTLVIDAITTQIQASQPLMLASELPSVLMSIGPGWGFAFL